MSNRDLRGSGPVLGWIGDPGQGTIRVELRGRGREDRVATTVLARTAEAPVG